MTDATIDKTATATAKKGRAATAAKPAAKPAPKAAAKPVTAKAPTAALAKTQAAPAPAALKIVASGPTPASEKAPQLKMKDLVERVVKASGAKKKGVKEIVEATLATLGDALAKGEAINLPGFGRAKVAHAEDKGAGKPMTIKLKSQPAADAKKPGKLPLAAPQD
jgi:nucleoid DNA-binding protein